MFYDEQGSQQTSEHIKEAPFDIVQESLSQDNDDDDDDSAESDYSLDYEYLGPRKANYRKEDDADSVASDLSSTSCDDGFDMWDEDPYSTNDFTWESNDIRLTFFIKKRQRQLDSINSLAPWQHNTFWKKERGWPKQLPASSSTTNHDQSANALSLVLSDLGSSEKLHAVYRDRIIECGKYDEKKLLLNTNNQKATANTTTWLDNDQPQDSINAAKICSDKFVETHASISHSSINTSTYNINNLNNNSVNTTASNDKFISKFIPYTKYIRRSHFPVILPQNSYLSLGFEPMCLAEKYGFMAIGGIEGEFELYCCMDHAKPIKIWGTKFKGKNNVLLMTNAVQIVRWKKKDQDYNYYLIACMNDAGLLIYDLPSHRQCKTSSICHLQCHIRSFDRVPINDARVSPDGKHLVCVGDEACIFHISISFNRHGKITFGSPQKLKIPSTILSLPHHQQDSNKPPIVPSTSLPQPLPIASHVMNTFSSQYVAWSKSSIYFAQTSDTQNNVFIWRTKPQFEMLYRIDAGGYTYAIQFHPEYEGVLAFSNRYGYIHTVDLEECISRQDPHRTMRIQDYDRQTSFVNGHTCTTECLQGDEAVHHTLHLFARHEITMVSFRGEKNKRLRILAKINGLQWSRDGRYLYVSTKKRVLAYEFVHSSCHVQSLEKMASLKALSILEENEQLKTTKRKQQDEQDETKRKRRIWCEKWCKIPAHVRHNVLGDTHLASHW